MKINIKTTRGLALAAMASLLLAACASALTTTQIATLEQAAAVGGAKSSDINPGDAYTSQTECAVLNGSWKWTGGGGGSGVPSGFSFPSCDLTGTSGVPGGAPMGPTVIGRTGTALQ